jgi:hypothetical protein
VKTKVPPPTIPPKIDNSVLNLVRKTCEKMMCQEVVKINDVTTKTL